MKNERYFFEKAVLLYISCGSFQMVKGSMHYTEYRGDIFTLNIDLFRKNTVYFSISCSVWKQSFFRKVQCSPDISELMSIL